MKKEMKIGALAVAGLTLGATQIHAAVESQTTNSMAQVNLASIQSMEASYLEVPRICKAGTANFDAAFEPESAASEAVLAFHAAL